MIDLNDAPRQGEALQSSARPSIDDVKGQLLDHWDELARELIGPINKALSSTQQLRANRKGSAAAETRGAKRGVWYTHEGHDGGGPLKLIEYSLGLPFNEAFNWALDWLGYPTDAKWRSNGSRPTGLSPNNGANSQPSAPPPDPLAEPAELSPEDEKRRATINTILQQCRDVAGTAADRYLARRGITRRPLPPSVQFRGRAFKGFDALVAIATDAGGHTRAVQQVYVTDDGGKAPVDVVKRTNKLHDNWSYHAAVRLPGSQPIVLCEGPETALSIWQATGHETWACLGVSNMGHAPVPDGASVIVARDSDEPGSSADRQSRKAITALRGRGLDLRVAQPPQDQDFNDVLESDGEQRVRELIDGAAASDAYSRAWRTGLLSTSEGMPRPVLANALHALRAAPEWQGVLWHDEFAAKTIARRPPPWVQSDAEANWTDQQWTDRDDALAAAWLQGEGILVPATVAGQAVETVARDRMFHPVREYLDVLRWDGVPRVDRWLSVYAHVEDTEYTRAVGQRWLISAVARIFRPGCKADCMLILEGPQGAGKSQALAALGRPWFTDRLSALGSKDSAVEIAGVWIVELAELDSLTRSEASAIKAYLSTTEDRYRPPYGKRTIEQPRQCVFAGTVNPEGGYLKDPTGGRRFWPVEVPAAIDVDRLARDRDQLWAEAVRLYRAGFPWYLEDRELETLAKAEQDERRQPDAWEQPVIEYLENEITYVQRAFGGLERQLISRPEPLSEVTTAEILRTGIDKPVEKWVPRDEQRVVGVLISMGFERRRRRDPNASKDKRIPVYVRKAESE